VTNRAQDRSLFLGGQWKPTQRLQVTADLGWVRSDESMSQIRFYVPEEVLAKLVDSIYDLTEAHTYSDLKTTRWEAHLKAITQVAPGLFGEFSYGLTRYLDDKPYLADLDGKLNVVQVGLRWTL
jgi:hypothetical protein